NPWIAKAQPEVVLWPLAVRVSVEERLPWLIVEFPQSSWVVATDGALVEPTDEVTNPRLVLEIADLPRVQFGSDVNRSQAAIDQRFAWGLDQLRLIRAAGWIPLEISRIVFHSGSDLEIVPSDPTVPAIWLAEVSVSDFAQRLNDLQRVLADLAERGERADEIDLRYSGQAIVRGGAAASGAS
ncbi:MAG: hypothetical protein KDD44_09990, partial [Bdellovibrionales bacterium]|nr:hypothetical protein [Bdellovibrionales bacterium]